MTKCPNCGSEIESGMKFCGECGTPLPQEKDCPKCRAKCKVSAKFCCECGYNFSTGTAGCDAALSLGDKNVIAGDVIGHQEDYKISGDATFVHNQDETHKMVQCHVCGRNITVASSFECPECHQLTCQNCFDRDAGACKACVDDKMTKKEQVYRQALMRVFEDGRVDLSERRDLTALQNELCIPASRAAELEKLVRVERTSGDLDADTKLSTFEKFSFSKAQSILVVDGEAEKAAELLKPIFLAHPLNEDVLSMYLSALVICDEFEAKRIISELQADILCAYVSGIDICLRNEDMTGAEVTLLSAESLWKDNVAVILRRAWFYCKMFAISSDASYIDKDKETVALVIPGDDMLLRSLTYCVNRLISKTNGEDVAEVTRDFCEANNLSYPFATGLLISNN